jgi:protein transport protein SEC31
MTVDTSKVPANMQPAVNSLRGLFDMCSKAPQMQAASKKRENEDNSKRLGQLLWKLNAGDISDRVAQQLLRLCQALDQGDLNTAGQVQVSLTATDWDECGQWLTALKRLIKTRQMMGR